MNRIKRKSKKAVSLVIASSMFFSVSGYTAFGASFKDTADHWASSQISTWSDYGVINGFDGLFRPNDSISRGEMAVMMDKIMQYQTKAENGFDDLDQNFYTDSILKASNAGVMRGADGKVRPNDKITREEAAVLICQVFDIKPLDTSSKQFNDSDKVSSWAQPYVNALLEVNYISGKGDNMFDPQGNITRGEAVTMLNNIVKALYNKAGTYTENIDGSVVVNTPNTVLKDMSISGDLIIAEGVAEGDLTLDNVKIAGTVLVRGGGINSIKIINNSNIANIKVDKQDGNVRVYSDSTAAISVVYIDDGSKDVILEGKFGSVQVDAANSTVRATNATIETASVTKASAKLIIDEKSTLKNLEIKESAANATVEVNGTVSKLDVAAPGAKLSVGKNATVTALNVTDSAINSVLTIEGTVTTLDTNAEGTQLNVTADAKIDTINVKESAVDSKLSILGKVTNINIDAPNVKVEVTEPGVVNTITTTKTANNVEIYGSGTVNTVNVGGNNNKINTSGTVVKVEKGVTGTLVGGTEVLEGRTVTSKEGGFNDGIVVDPNNPNTVPDPNNPTDDEEIQEDAIQQAPEGLEGKSATSLENADAKITGTTVEMEYSSDGTNYTDCTDGETIVEPGTYQVRYKKKPGFKAGKDTEVEVGVTELASVVISEDDASEVVKSYKKTDTLSNDKLKDLTATLNYNNDHEPDTKVAVKFGDDFGYTIVDGKVTSVTVTLKELKFDNSIPTYGTTKEMTLKLKKSEISDDYTEPTKVVDYLVLNDKAEIKSFTAAGETVTVNGSNIEVTVGASTDFTTLEPEIEVPYGATIKVDGDELEVDTKSGDSEYVTVTIPSSASVDFSKPVEINVRSEDTENASPTYTVTIKKERAVYTTRYISKGVDPDNPDSGDGYQVFDANGDIARGVNGYIAAFDESFGTFTVFDFSDGWKTTPDDYTGQIYYIIIDDGSGEAENLKNQIDGAPADFRFDIENTDINKPVYGGTTM